MTDKFHTKPFRKALEDSVTDFQKVLFVAQAIVKNGYITQNFKRSDFEDAIKKRAAETRKAGETPEQAFARVAEHDPDGQILVRAMRYAADNPLKKSYLTGDLPGRATLEPRSVQGRAAQAVDDPVDALAALERLVDEQLRAQAGSGKTREQVFAAVYTQNPQLAAAERRQRLSR